MNYTDLLWVSVFLAGPVDVGLTLLNWELEGNPIVLWLGPTGMVLVKTFALGGVLWSWYYFKLESHNVAQMCVGFLAMLYASVALTNTMLLVA